MFSAGANGYVNKVLLKLLGIDLVCMWPIHRRIKLLLDFEGKLVDFIDSLSE